jgi:methyl coenzyme M reductase subunit C
VLPERTRRVARAGGAGDLRRGAVAQRGPFAVATPAESLARSMRVKHRRSQRALTTLGTLALACAALFALGGCPVDKNDVITATVQAALDAASKSFVDSLSAYLASQ